MEAHPPGETGRHAGLGKRFVAVLIDSIVVFVLSLVLVVLFVPLLLSGGSPPAAGEIGVLQILLGLLGLGYFVGLEGAYGYTLGKSALGIVVKHEDGSDLDYGPAAVRNVLRIVDGIPGSLYLIGAILVLVTDDDQRLGDIAADTVVLERP